MSKQYLANVALKINVKVKSLHAIPSLCNTWIISFLMVPPFQVGGRNTVLVDALTRRIPLVSDRPTIIFGADVTHPHPGEDSSPSIAAVSATHVTMMIDQKFCCDRFPVMIVPFPGCCFARLAWGHQVCWTSECSSPSPGADSGSFQSMARSTTRDSNWWHDQVWCLLI